MDLLFLFRVTGWSNVVVVVVVAVVFDYCMILIFALKYTVLFTLGSTSFPPWKSVKLCLILSFCYNQVNMGAFARIEGVELYHLGQHHSIGKYPLHFHMCDEVHGQYFRNNSIRDSFSRCITLHGTDYAEVRIISRARE